MNIEKGIMAAYLKNRKMSDDYLQQADAIMLVDPYTCIDLRGRAIGLLEANQTLAECLMEHGFSIDLYMQSNLD